MKRYKYGHKAHIEKVIGMSLGVIGFLIVINVMPVRFLLLLIGIALLLMGTLLFIK